MKECTLSSRTGVPSATSPRPRLASSAAAKTPAAIVMGKDTAFEDGRGGGGSV
jgi:hypothetical protein